MKKILGFQVNVFYEDQNFLLFVCLVTDGNMEITDTWDEATKLDYIDSSTNSNTNSSSHLCSSSTSSEEEKKRKRYKKKKNEERQKVTRSKGEGEWGIVNLRLVL